jgi:hypothetical protein
VVVLPQDEAGRLELQHAWVVDANLGLLKRQVELAPGAQWPAPADCVQVRAGERLFLFPRAERGELDLQAAAVLDTAALRVAPIAFAGHQPGSCCADVLALDDAAGHPALLVVPRRHDRSPNYAQLCLIDLSPGAAAAGALPCRLLALESPGALPALDCRFFAVGQRVFAVSSDRRHANVVGVLAPFEGKAQAYAADIRGQASAGLDVERSGADLVFVPLDANGRRCPADVSILDCNLVV